MQSPVEVVYFLLICVVLIVAIPIWIGKAWVLLLVVVAASAPQPVAITISGTRGSVTFRRALCFRQEVIFPWNEVSAVHGSRQVMSGRGEHLLFVVALHFRDGNPSVRIVCEERHLDYLVSTLQSRIKD